MRHPCVRADWLKNELKDDDFVARYLMQAARDLKPAVFATALRYVVDVLGASATFARQRAD